jgi:hypothetical protein
MFTILQALQKNSPSALVVQAARKITLELAPFHHSTPCNANVKEFYTVKSCTTLLTLLKLQVIHECFPFLYSTANVKEFYTVTLNTIAKNKY